MVAPTTRTFKGWFWLPVLAEEKRDLLQLYAFLVTQMRKNPPATQEMWVWSLGGEGLLEKEMPTHSSILVWRILWAEEPGRLQSTGSQSHNRITNSFTFIALWERGPGRRIPNLWATREVPAGDFERSPFMDDFLAESLHWSWQAVFFCSVHGQDGQSWTQKAGVD